MGVLTTYTISRAKELRSKQTDAEKIFWSRLRAKRFLGIKFKRQQPLGKYIVDFISFEKMLIVELDGGQHNMQKGIAYDDVRTRYLKDLGYTVLRFWNNDVIRNIDEVLERIRLSIPSL